MTTVPAQVAVARLARAYPTLSPATIVRLYDECCSLLADGMGEPRLDAAEQLARTRLDMCEFAEADRRTALLAR